MEVCSWGNQRTSSIYTYIYIYGEFSSRLCSDTRGWSHLPFTRKKHIVWFQNVPKMCKDALLNHGDSGVFFIGMRGRYEGILGASKPSFDWWSASPNKKLSGGCNKYMVWYLVNIWLIIIWLVVQFHHHEKYDGVRQWERWHPIYLWWKIIHSCLKPPTSKNH